MSLKGDRSSLTGFPLSKPGWAPQYYTTQINVGYIRCRLRGLILNPPQLNDWEGLETESKPVPAAVLVPLVVRAEQFSVLLTKRAEHLHHHPGQVSFPGGRVEDVDTSPVETALRETQEEIGLDRRHVELLGTLPDYLTGTGFRVTPVVGLVHPPFTLTLDAFEVAEAFEVPLSHFLDPANHESHTIVHEGHERRFHAMPYQGHFIWGATAGIIMSLYQLLQAERQAER